MCVSNKFEICNGVAMTIQGTMCVSEIQTPYFDCLVGARRCQDGIIITGINCQCGKFVTVKTQKELESVIKENLDSGVQSRNKNHSFRWVRRMRVTYGDNIVGHLQCSRMNCHWMPWLLVFVVLRFNIPELHCFVGRSCHKSYGFLLWSWSTNV